MYAALISYLYRALYFNGNQKVPVSIFGQSWQYLLVKIVQELKVADLVVSCYQEMLVTLDNEKTLIHRTCISDNAHFKVNGYI